MLSKEEIEKAKDDLKFFNEGEYITSEIDRSAKVLEKYISQLENKVESKEMVHQYDMKMINEVKGEAVNLYNKIDKLNRTIDEMVNSFYKLYQKIPGTMHKFFENGKLCEYGYDKATNECKEINCKSCIKKYFEEKAEES